MPAFLKKLSLLLFCPATVLLAQDGNSLDSIRRYRMDSLFTVMEQNAIFNGSVLVTEKGHVIYKRSGGYAIMENKTLNTDTTQFNLASVSKIFTSLAILQLVGKGKLRLDDPVNVYLKSFPYPAIKIRHLLSHFSGLPRAEDFERDYIRSHQHDIITDDTLYTHLLSLKDSLTNEPGEKFGYNNMNYVLLSMIIEKVSGKIFPSYMHENIFRPAGMKRTYVRQPHQPNTPRYIIPALYETNYKHVDSLDPMIYATDYHLGGMQGPSNIISTLKDLSLFDKALTRGKLCSPSLLRKAFEPTIDNNGKQFFMGTSKRSYGLGWNSLYTIYGDTCVFHDGNIPGVTSMLYKNLTKDQTIFYYENALSPGFFQKIFSISNILNNQPAVQLLKTGTKKSAAKEYVKVLMQDGADHAAVSLMDLRADTANYFLNELEMNSLGYDLHFKAVFPGHNELALEVMKVNVLLYKSANAFDSYGDVLMNTGKIKEAIQAYKRSLALNPGNTNAKKNLAILENEPKKTTGNN